MTNLIQIAEQAKPDKTSRKDAEVTKLIQQNIFDIINELAKEIGLGGEIKPEIRSNCILNFYLPLVQQSKIQDVTAPSACVVNNKNNF